MKTCIKKQIKKTLDLLEETFVDLGDFKEQSIGTRHPHPNLVFGFSIYRTGERCRRQAHDT